MKYAISSLENTVKKLVEFSVTSIGNIEMIGEATADCKAAIEILQRKVKKDPRIDGLPELCKQLILWTKNHGIVLGSMVSCYQKGVADKSIYETAWHFGGTGVGDNYGIFLKIDDILFYCDPDDIV